ncbi:hypothetical protein BGZ68_005700 [Mortierella alpina]|nr:hypothetical protein BGZ68_005700 [Mortierella alpina]
MSANLEGDMDVDMDSDPKDLHPNNQHGASDSVTMGQDTNDNDDDDMADLIDWFKKEVQRIQEEIRMLREQGQEPVALVAFCEMLQKQINSLEMEYVMEKTATLSV